MLRSSFRLVAGGNAAYMALQRTRGLSAAQCLFSGGRRSAVQTLSGGRSPLNARSLGDTEERFTAGLAIMIVVLGFNFLGDGLRDILDPRLRAS